MSDGSLEGFVAATTAIAHVDGRAGLAIVRGYPLADLASKRSYEDVAHLVLRGELPVDALERERFELALRDGTPLAPDDENTARSLGVGRDKADALAGAMVLAEDPDAHTIEDPIARAERVLGRIPSVCAAVTGVPQPPPEGTYASRALVALGARRTDAAALHAFETLLVLESEHGFSASTFACRVAASSGAGAGPSLAAAVATLSGPRHGGATAQALTMLGRAHAHGDPRAFVQAENARRARLPGFGHRIYKVRDPRLVPLRTAMLAMGEVPLFATAEGVRAEAEALHGAKGVFANIDLYSAVLLDALGIEPPQFVAAFALGLSCGWLAHWVEQRATGRLIRPDSAYAGPPQRAVP